MSETSNSRSGTPAPTPPEQAPAPPDLSAKSRGKRRLLRGLQRISSSQSLNGLRRSKSVNSPYATTSSFSCVSLAATGPLQTPPNGRSGTPQPSPLGYPSTTSSVAHAQEGFPFEAAEGDLPIRKVQNGASTPSPSTSQLPAEIKSSKLEGQQSKTRPGLKAVQKPPFQFWRNLPQELQVYIFSFLQPMELVQVSRSSKAFYKFCFDGQLWTSLDASKFYQEIPAESLARIIVAAGPFIKDLNLRGCVQVEHYKRTEVIVKACKNLMNATLEGCHHFQKNTLHSLLRNNEKLVRLNLTGLSAVSNTSCEIIAESCPQLEAFNISWCDRVDAKGVRAVVEACPRLKDLRVGEVRGFSDVETAETIFRTNSLERLVLSGCVDLDDRALQTMVHGTEPEVDILTDRPILPSRKLRHLDLSRCTRLTDAGVKALGHLVPDLEGLQLSSCRQLTDDALEPVLAATPRLTHLELEDIEGLTNALLSEHLVKAPCASKLEHLSISYCENLGDSGVLPVMKVCTRLRSVDMDNTRISDLVLLEAACMVAARSKREELASVRPEVTLQMDVYDCQNVTWTGIREVLCRNASVVKVPGPGEHATYPSEIIGLKCFHGYQMTVGEHQKRVLRNDFTAARRLERKWADYMQATEEAGVLGSGYRRRRRRAREAQALHLHEEDGSLNFTGRRRARTTGTCSVM